MKEIHLWPISAFSQEVWVLRSTFFDFYSGVEAVMAAVFKPIINQNTLITHLQSSEKYLATYRFIVVLIFVKL